MAIAFDNATDIGQTGAATSLTGAHIVTGTNTFLVVGVVGAVLSDLISGVTYNGVAMTLLDKYHMFAGADRWAYAFYLVNPPTGSNNVVVSASSSSFIAAVAASYTGVFQGAIDNSLTTKNDGTGQATLNNAITSVADNCWHIGMTGAASGAGGAGTGTTQRVQQATQTNLLIIDNNAAITPAGSNTIQLTLTGGIQAGPVIFGITIAPVPPSVIKTIDGLARASVKIVDGLAIASVKTWNGLV